MGNPSRLNTLAACGAAILAVGVMLFMAVASQHFFGAINDLPEYLTAAVLMVHGQGSIVYKLQQFFAAQQSMFPSLGARGIGLFLPPMAAPFLLPLALMPIAQAPWIWTFVLFAALLASTWVLKRLYKLNTEHTAWLLTCIAASGPAIEGVRIGQLAPLLLLTLCAFTQFVQSNSWIKAGLVFSLLLMKPQQMWPLAVFLLGAGRYRILLITAAAFGVLTLISLGILGVGGYQDYLSTLQDPSTLAFMQPKLNATVRGQLMRILGEESMIPNAVAMVSLVASTVFIFLLGKRASINSKWLQIGLLSAMPIGLLTSLHCHDYDLLLLAPGFVVLATGAAGVQLHKPLEKIIVGIGLVTFLIPFYNDIHYNYLEKGGILNPHFIVLLAYSIFAGWSGWKAAVELRSDIVERSSEKGGGM